jgi:hypothetical protein
VLGVESGGVARAYPFPVVTEADVINERVGDLPVVVATATGDTLVAYDRRVGGNALWFEGAGDRHITAGGSRWDRATGRAVDGSHEGRQLGRANDNPPMFRTGWSEFFPGTEVYGLDLPEDRPWLIRIAVSQCRIHRTNRVRSYRYTVTAIRMRAESLDTPDTAQRGPVASCRSWKKWCHMERRRLLLGGGVLLAGFVPGCVGGSDSDGETPTPETTPTEVEVTIEDGSSGTETPSPTPTATPTDTPTAQPTPTPTPAAGVTHDMNARFTVGEGDEAIGYRIIEYARADRIGSQADREDADGTFLVVILEVTNPQDEILALPRNEFRVRSPSTWHKYNTRASEKIDSDSRISEPSLVDASIRSGSSKIGSIAFDVNPDSSYRVWIFPTGNEDSPDHFVPVGNISAIREL